MSLADAQSLGGDRNGRLGIGAIGFANGFDGWKLERVGLADCGGVGYVFRGFAFENTLGIVGAGSFSFLLAESESERLGLKKEVPGPSTWLGSGSVKGSRRYLFACISRESIS